MSLLEAMVVSSAVNIIRCADVPRRISLPSLGSGLQGLNFGYIPITQSRLLGLLLPKSRRIVRT
jgi:hypothetical protein